jgi:hypothetical protein
MVYPSYGEGFGFIPLQALGTGMPIISTHAWAPYDKHLKEYCIGSRYDRSIWSLHPGNVLYPSYDDLKTTMRFIANRDELEFAQNLYYLRAEQVHREYDWVTKTEQAFRHLVPKFTEL